MRALDKELHDYVLTTVDEKFYLFAIIGKSYPNAGSKRLDPFNSRAPVGEGVVSGNSST